MPEGRRSAVARRRLQRPGTAGITATSVNEPPVILTISSPVAAPGSPRSEAQDVDGTSEGTAPDDNSFASLVPLQTIASTSTREVEQISSSATKVRLSRGQTCTILGACTLWVRDGSVSVYGATLSVSQEVYPIYAPTTYALPRIEALTKFAEVQLESVHDDLPGLPRKALPLWRPYRVKSTVSYFILDHTFERDALHPGRYTILDTDSWKTILASVGDTLPHNRSYSLDNGTEQSASATLKRILVWGKRSTGVSTFSRCLLNRLLTRDKNGSTHLKGVLLLELDFRSPKFSPPGTISLVHVGRPVFGPQFTNLAIAKAQPNRVLQMHFVGLPSVDDPPEQIIPLTRKLLKLVDQISSDYDCLVINGSSWLNAADADHIKDLWRSLQPTDVIALGARLPEVLNSPPWQELWHAGVDCTVHEIPTEKRFKSPSQQLPMHLKSYFLFQEHRFGRPWWYDSMTCGRPRQDLRLYPTDSSESNAARLCLVRIQNGHLALQDVVEALEGAVVAVLEHTETIMRRETEYTPELISCVRESASALHSKCLGLAYVDEIDLDAGIARVYSPIVLSGLNIAIVLDRTMSHYGNMMA